MYRIGLFYCAAPLSGAFGGLLATGLAEINYHNYHGKVIAISSDDKRADYKPRMAVDLHD